MTHQRSTLRLLDAVDEAATSNEVPLLTGNTTDVFVARSGAVFGLPHLLAHEAADQDAPTVVFSLARGSHQLNPAGRVADCGLRHVTTEDGLALGLTDLLAQLRTTSVPVRFVVDYCDLLLPSTGSLDSAIREQERLIELLAEQALDQAAGRSPHRMLILSRAGGSVDDRLARLPGFRTIAVGLPDRAERHALLTRLLAPAVGEPLLLGQDLDLEVAATLTGGLASVDLLHARDLSQAKGCQLTRAWIQARKSATIARLAGDTLVVHPAGRGLADVAGLPQVRLLIQECRVTGRPPRRILLAGPPGVGKTLVVRAIADEFGYPVVSLGNYRNMYVGETERRFRLALQVVQDLAPCVLHIDEIDQSVGQRTTGQSSDGGTSERVLADMWTFLGDNTRSEHVTVIATTNRPELLDPAMFDRFEIIPVLHPTPPEAADILRISAEREGQRIDLAQAEAEVSRYGRLVTGRILVDVMDRAITLAAVDAAPLGASHLRAAFGELLSALAVDEHEHLALRAIALTTFASRLPWEAARRLGHPVHLPDYLTGLVDPDTLQLDLARLGWLTSPHRAHESRMAG